MPRPVFAALLWFTGSVLLAADGFDAARATNAVGLDLYRQLAPAKAGGNLVLSPYSIESALALAYAGADGDTRSEMAHVLHFPADNAALQEAFSALRRSLREIAEESLAIARVRSRSGGRTDPIEWHAANRLFGQQGYAFRDAFLTLMKDGFDAPFAATDFARNPDGARAKINGWVEEQTRRKIKDLIPTGALGRDTRLVLVNALYLKAPWQSPFAKASTQPRPFRAAAGVARDVPTMHRTGAMGYARDEGVTVVTLDYLHAGLQFLILLPDEGTTPDELAARLTPEHFARWSKLPSAARREVALYLPRFKVEGSTIRLGEALRALGVLQAFDVPPGSANFDGIAPRRPNDYLSIDDVFHQTFVAVDEEGTEAAAATAVTMRTLSAPAHPPQPVEVRVDRPFLFAIQHRTSGACLFLGRISEP